MEGIYILEDDNPGMTLHGNANFQRLLEEMEI
jgi:hypothetical protein